jgi:hypothetical protein
MKFRIIEVPRFDNWSGEYEMTFSVQQKVWFWWVNIYRNLTSLTTAQSLIERIVRTAASHKNKPTRKVVKEIEV